MIETDQDSDSTPAGNGECLLMACLEGISTKKKPVYANPVDGLSINPQSMKYSCGWTFHGLKGVIVLSSRRNIALSFRHALYSLFLPSFDWGVSQYFAM